MRYYVHPRVFATIMRHEGITILDAAMVALGQRNWFLDLRMPKDLFPEQRDWLTCGFIKNSAFVYDDNWDVTIPEERYISKPFYGANIRYKLWRRVE